MSVFWSQFDSLFIVLILHYSCFVLVVQLGFFFLLTTKNNDFCLICKSSLIFLLLKCKFFVYCVLSLHYLPYKHEVVTMQVQMWRDRKLLLLLIIGLGIRHTSVVNRLQTLYQYLLSNGDIFKRNRAVGEITAIHLVVDKCVY